MSAFHAISGSDINKLHNDTGLCFDLMHGQDALLSLPCVAVAHDPSVASVNLKLVACLWNWNDSTLLRHESSLTPLYMQVSVLSKKVFVPGPTATCFS